MKKLLMVIGVSGSGKTTFAENYKKTNADFADANIWEADKYFIDSKTGKYNWDYKKLGEAHKWCQKNVEADMINGLNVIVSNTSLTTYERRPYFILAKKYGYEVIVHTCKGNYKNVHDVLEEKVMAMKRRFTPFTVEELDDINLNF